MKRRGTSFRSPKMGGSYEKTEDRRHLSVQNNAETCQAPIWRRFLVESDMKLSDLHKVIQTVMGWSNDHLHAFRIGRVAYATPDRESMMFEADGQRLRAPGRRRRRPHPGRRLGRSETPIASPSSGGSGSGGRCCPGGFQAARSGPRPPRHGLPRRAPPSMEQWKLVCPLRAHANNVTDLSWSPGRPPSRHGLPRQHDRRLGDGSTGSAPNSIKIVATLEGPRVVREGRRLRPSGQVPGLAVRRRQRRPGGRTTGSPRRGSPARSPGGFVSSTFSTRLSWAPDGTFLVACNAFDARAGGAHGAAGLSREELGERRTRSSATLAPVVALPRQRQALRSAVRQPGRRRTRRRRRRLLPASEDPSRGRARRGAGRARRESLRLADDASRRPSRSPPASSADRSSTWLGRPTASRCLRSLPTARWRACSSRESELGSAGRGRGAGAAEAAVWRREGEERPVRRDGRAARSGERRRRRGAEAGAGVGAPAAPAPLGRRQARREARSGEWDRSGLFRQRQRAAAPAEDAVPSEIHAASDGDDDASAAAGATGARPVFCCCRRRRSRHHSRPSSRSASAGPVCRGPACNEEAAPRREPLVAAPPAAARVARRRAGALRRRQCFLLGRLPWKPPRRRGHHRGRQRPGPPHAPRCAPASHGDGGPLPGFERKGRQTGVGGRVPGGVSQLVASRRFAAAATGGSPLDGGGALLLWSRAGRRLAPPLSLSAPIVHLATDDGDDSGEDLGGSKTGTEGQGDLQREQQRQQRGWGLLAITADGGVHCWDVRARSLTLRTSLAPLLAVASASAAEAAAAAAAAAAPLTTAAADASAAVAPPPSSAPPVGLVSARLCRATGAPTVVLSDFSAAVFDVGLGGWARVADGVSSTAAARPLGARPRTPLPRRRSLPTPRSRPPPPRRRPRRDALQRLWGPRGASQAPGAGRRLRGPRGGPGRRREARRGVLVGAAPPPRRPRARPRRSTRGRTSSPTSPRPPHWAWAPSGGSGRWPTCAT